jgi:hypothetical protein
MIEGRHFFPSLLPSHLGLGNIIARLYSEQADARDRPCPSHTLVVCEVLFRSYSGTFLTGLSDFLLPGSALFQVRCPRLRSGVGAVHEPQPGHVRSH